MIVFVLLFKFIVGKQVDDGGYIYVGCILEYRLVYKVEELICKVENNFLVLYFYVLNRLWDSFFLNFICCSFLCISGKVGCWLFEYVFYIVGDVLIGWYIEYFVEKVVDQLYVVVGQACSFY